MIDLHCHILPALDDGPRTLVQALTMCRRAAAEGVKTIVATPHYRPNTFDITGPGIGDAVRNLNREIRSRGIPISILAGAEVAIGPEITGCLTPRGHLTLNQSRYFLAEFPPVSVPIGWKAFLQNFRDAGLIPIIAHPERNAWFMHHPDALASVVQGGIKIQVTAMSLTGGFGPAARNGCIRLLRQGLVHVIASDGHSDTFRPPLLVEAVRRAADVVGMDQALAMVTTNPLAIIEDRPIPEPFADGSRIKYAARSRLQRIIDGCFPSRCKRFHDHVEETVTGQPFRVFRG